MKYAMVTYLGQDKYTYSQGFHDNTYQNSVEACRARLTGLNEYLQGGRITCYSYIIHSLDEDTGEFTVVESNMFKNPLKTRVEINKEAKTKKTTTVTLDGGLVPRFRMPERAAAIDRTVGLAGFGFAEPAPPITNTAPRPARNTVTRAERDRMIRDEAARIADRARLRNEMREIERDEARRVVAVVQDGVVLE